MRHVLFAAPHPDAELLAERIYALRARTMKGHRARARSLTVTAPDVLRGGRGSTDQVLPTALLRDLVEEGGS